METYNIEMQRASIQISDSKSYDLPEDYSVAYPVAPGYICIPTIADHLDGVKLDVYRNKVEQSATDLELMYQGEIVCDSSILKITSGLPANICDVTFEEPGAKHIEIWANSKDQPTHIAISLF